MNTTNLTVDLDPKEDKNDNTYHLGRLKFPGTIDCSNGVAFLIFLSEACEEELQIASLDKENSTFSQFSKREDRLKIRLESRTDAYDKIFYVAKIQFRGYIRCNQEVVFIVFTSKKNYEELQVVGEVEIFTEDQIIPAPAQPVVKDKPEIILKRVTTFVNESYDESTKIE